MDHLFGEGYISQVKQQQAQHGQHEGEFNDSKTTIVKIAGDVALRQLRNVLLAMNAIAFFIIPALSWYLAKKNLTPIQIAHEKQKQFVSDASHELRTPLAIMTGEIDVALKKVRFVNEYQDILTSTKEELIKLTSLVENLLFLAREDQNNLVVLTDTVDLTDLLSTLIVQLKPIYTKKNLAVHFQPAKENIVVKGNTSLLNQLFFNLLDNAVKYTHKGTIQVSLNQEHKFAKVSIKDTGIGISPAVQGKIFERFYRADSSRSLSKGYGLGLAICRVIVNRHWGSLTVHSQEGKGATFVVSLPITFLKSF